MHVTRIHCNNIMKPLPEAPWLFTYPVMSAEGRNAPGRDAVSSGTQQMSLLLAPADGRSPDENDSGYECPNAVLAKRGDDSKPATSQDQQMSSDYLDLCDNTSGLSENGMCDYETVSSVPVDRGLNTESRNTSVSKRINHDPPLVHPAPPNDDPSRPASGYDDVVVGNNTKQPDDGEGQDRFYVNKKVFANRRIGGKNRPMRKRNKEGVGATDSVPHEALKSGQGSVKPVGDPSVTTEYVYDYAENSSDLHPSPGPATNGGKKSPGPGTRDGDSPHQTNDIHDYIEVYTDPHPSPRASSAACTQSTTQGQDPPSDGGYQALDPAGMEKANTYTPLILESTP